MAIVTQYQDADEFFHDSDAELLANQQIYGVLSGCAVTYDAANLTIDVAAGVEYHNATAVAVAAAANALTLVADSSNERWSYVTLNSSGTAVLVSGDPAANASTEPTKPELGDRVWLSAVKIEAGQTIADNISVKLDKRLPVAGPWTVVATSDVTIQSDASVNNDSALLFPLPASTRVAFEACIIYNSGTTPDFLVAFDAPTSSTISWLTVTDDAAGTLRSITTNSAGAAATVSVEGNGAVQAFKVVGFVKTSTTAGNLQFMWAQNTSDASNTIRKEGSWLRVHFPWAA